jgi:RNA polymerase sigma-70 factor (ECF subfamily)
MDQTKNKAAPTAESRPESIDSIYDRTFARVYNAIRYRVPDAATAEELTAEVYERAFRSLERYRPEQGVVDAWLFGIVHHVVGSSLRRRRLIAWVSFEALWNHSTREPLPEDISIQHSLEEQLLRQLPRLKDRERELLGLKYAGGLSNRQIAALAGLTEQNVGVILYRAVARLRQWMCGAADSDFSPRVDQEVEHES